MTAAEMLARTQAALSELETVHAAIKARVQNRERGDPWFETDSSYGGAICNLEHAAGMVAERLKSEG